MVKLENHLGVIDVSHDYLEGLVKNAVASCYGIAGLAAPKKKKGLLRWQRAFPFTGGRRGGTPSASSPPRRPREARGRAEI